MATQKRKEFEINELQKFTYVAVIICIGVLAIFLLALTVNEIKMYPSVGENNPATPNVIMVEGEGKATSTPNIATISFGGQATAATVSEAESQVTISVNKAIDYLKQNGVSNADIQTDNFSVNPHVEVPICSGNTCSPGREASTSGYDVNENVNVTLRNVQNAGTIIAGLTSQGVTNISGPNFSIDDQSALEDSAREMAIYDARSKAIILARELGVTLGKVVSFNENQNPVYPMAKNFSADSVAASVPTPDIETGSNTITSDVTITYEIK